MVRTEAATNPLARHHRAEPLLAHRRASIRTRDRTVGQRLISVKWARRALDDLMRAGTCVAADAIRRKTPRFAANRHPMRASRDNEYRSLGISDRDCYSRFTSIPQVNCRMGSDPPRSVKHARASLFGRRDGLAQDLGEVIDTLPDVDAVRKSFLHARWLDQVLFYDHAASRHARWYNLARTVTI